MLAEWQSQLSKVLVLPNSDPGEQAEKTAEEGALALRGIDARRLALYQELMFNTVLESLQSIYPYSYQLISNNKQDTEVWAALAETYRRVFPNPSHKLMGAVESFPRFLATQTDWMARYPFLSELALYEWLEMQVLNQPDEDTPLSLPGLLPEPNVLAQYAPVWNPVRTLQHFTFNIPELITALAATVEEEAPEPALSSLLAQVEPQPVDVLIYREPQTLQVRFFCLNGMTSLLMQLSSAQPKLSYTEVLHQLQAMTPALHALPFTVILEQAAGLFQNCLENGMLLGSISLQPNL